MCCWHIWKMNNSPSKPWLTKALAGIALATSPWQHSPGCRSGEIALATSLWQHRSVGIALETSPKFASFRKHRPGHRNILLWRRNATDLHEMKKSIPAPQDRERNLPIRMWKEHRLPQNNLSFAIFVKWRRQSFFAIAKAVKPKLCMLSEMIGEELPAENE